MYTNFILNLCRVCELNNWPHNPANRFPLKDCLFGPLKLLRNAVKSKVIYNGRIIAFNGEGSWSFDNEFARNAVIFGFDNSSSFYTNNQKNNFLVLAEGPINDINDNTRQQKRD